MREVDVAVIGGGPAGLSAAVAAREAGAENILILERDFRLGGILNQCIHNGFGLHLFGEELTGPEYAGRFIRRAEALNIPALLGTMVLEITPDRVITAVNTGGVVDIRAGAIVLCMGCRERPRGALNIPGDRPVGIYTAGTAQKFVNIDGYLPGGDVVVLGSGDIGLIMARRMVLEGARVHAVVELQPYSGGLKRNVVQCLEDFDIPLLLSHTVTQIRGRERLEGVCLAPVDETLRPRTEEETFIPCDTLLLSVGLLPENELSRSAGVELAGRTGGPVVGEGLETSVEGIFACGNVLHVHDLVDDVSQESALAGRRAARYALGERRPPGPAVPVISGAGVRYTVPAHVAPGRLEDALDIRFRVRDVCTGGRVTVRFDGEPVYSRKKRILTPGEMETVTLDAGLLRDRRIEQITVSVEEVKPE